MDPSRNAALHNAKLQTFTLPPAQRQPGAITPTCSPSPDMPSPPAYHTIFDPADPLLNMHDAYDDVADEDKEQDVPEININATTQIRGHGNIISIAQMDSMRIANLLAILVHGGLPPQDNVQAAQSHVQAQVRGQQEQSGPQMRPEQLRKDLSLPRMNITINCGATVIGDRNIVGPGLGDIARHIQIAQQRQQAQQAQQRQQQQAQEGQKQDAAGDQNPRTPAGSAYPVPPQTAMATPPMSRSASFDSDAKPDVNVLKRKADDEDDGAAPMKRRG